MSKKCLIMIMLLWNAAIMSKAQNMAIVSNGRSTAKIVLPETASQQLKDAAATLSDYIRQSTGASLPVVTSSQGGISIHVGVTPLVANAVSGYKNLDQDGFILQRVDSKNLVIVGGSDWGTEFGVYYFLENYLGISWLMPTDLGTDVPQRSSLSIGAVKVVKTPVYLSRQLSPIHIYSNDALGIWGRRNGLHDRIAFHHNMDNVFNLKNNRKLDPQFFSTVRGKRALPLNSTDSKWQPNFSAPGIADVASANVIDYFKKNPDKTSFSLGVNDSRNFDESSASRARRSGRSNYLGLEDVSDDYFTWANQVAKKTNAVFPDKMFGVLAYVNVAEPPSSRVGIDPHIVPFITYERMRWGDPQLKAQDEDLTNRWNKMSSSTGWYDYAYGNCYLVPRVYFHTMQDYLSWGAAHKVKYYYAEVYPNWGEGPKTWILTKLLWNPNQDVDSLLNTWYVRTAGEKAAPRLKAFYDIWEKFWTRDIFKASGWNTSKGEYLPFTNLGYLNAVPQDYIAKADRLMEDAYLLTDSPQHKSRVAKLREMWKFYKLAIETYAQNSGTFAKNGQVLRASPQFMLQLNKFKSDSLFALVFDGLVTQRKIIK